MKNINEIEVSQFKETMSSKEIANVTGKEHSNIMRDIRNILEQLENKGAFNFELSSYKSEQNKDVPMYLLDKKACLLLASGYDANLRAKIINRWEELESKNLHAFSIPQTYSQALMLAAKQAEQIEEQNKLIEEQKPKADFYDAVTGSKDAIDMALCAKTLNMGIGRNRLFEFLRTRLVLDRNNIPYQKFIDRGYFRTIEQKYTKPDGTTCINIKTVVYQKGMEYIRNLIENAGR